MAMKRPATMEAYKDLINQAPVEVDELRMSIEYDEEFMEGSMALVGVQNKELQGLPDSIEKDEYQFKDKDLGYMTSIEGSNPGIMPFRPLLRLINQTHRKGLETEE